MRFDAIFLVVVISVVSFFAFMNEAKAPIQAGLAELPLKDYVIHHKCTLDGIIPEDIAGALAPSMSDVAFYRGFRESHGLEEAWITNGLQTSRFHAGEFDVLMAR